MVLFPLPAQAVVIKALLPSGMPDDLNASLPIAWRAFPDTTAPVPPQLKTLVSAKSPLSLGQNRQQGGK